MVEELDANQARSWSKERVQAEIREREQEIKADETVWEDARNTELADNHFLYRMVLQEEIEFLTKLL